MAKVNGRYPRKKTSGPFVKLCEWMLASPAWCELDCVSRSLYVEIARRYRGMNSNNGKIPYGAREAARDLGVSKTTANKCFQKLIEHGFLIVAQRSGFNRKGRIATEWLLTEFPDDRAGKMMPAAKDFMRWKPPEKSKHSPPTGTVSPSTGTTMH